MTKVYPIALGVALLSSGCVCDLNWERYKPVLEADDANMKTITDDFVIPSVGTDHINNSGFTSDIRAPFSVHTRLSTYSKVSTYEIESLILESDSVKKEMLHPEQIPVKVPCSENPYGLNIGRHTFDQVFSVSDPVIVIKLEGRVILQDSKIPFSIKKSFRLDKGRKRWLGISDIMSI